MLRNADCNHIPSAQTSIESGFEWVVFDCSAVSRSLSYLSLGILNRTNVQHRSLYSSIYWNKFQVLAKIGHPLKCNATCICTFENLRIIKDITRLVTNPYMRYEMRGFSSLLPLIQGPVTGLGYYNHLQKGWRSAI